MTLTVGRGTRASLALASLLAPLQAQAAPGDTAEPAQAVEPARLSLDEDTSGELEVSWDRGVAKFSGTGSISRPAPETDQRFKEALLDARASIPLYSRLSINLRKREFDGLFVLAQLGAAGYTLDPQVAGGPDRFYRFSAGASLAWLNTWPALLTFYAGARVAESEDTLSDPSLRPLALALATHRLAPGFALIYGAGFTYHLGRGLPLPFLGFAWEFTPDWSWLTLLPASTYVQYRANADWQFALGVALDGDTFGYQATDDAGQPASHTLGVARLKFLGRLTYGGRRDPQLRFDVGVQGTRVDPDRASDDVEATTHGGVFARAMCIVPWGD